jgi:hypothetical protein
MQDQLTPSNVAMLRLQQALDQKAKQQANTHRIAVATTPTGRP